MNNSPPNITMTRRQFLALTGGITSVSALGACPRMDTVAREICFESDFAIILGE